MTSIDELYRYEILSKDNNGNSKPIAEHGMGKVYKAYDHLFTEIVALKVVRYEVLQKQPEKAKRAFMAEAIAGASLSKNCPHIVRVLDIGQFEDVLYMSQEWIPGGNLEKLCGNVDLAKARTIILQISNAVRVAHEAGVVHSDISPPNILVNENRGLYKLSDFGLLKLIDRTSFKFSGSSLLLTGGRRNYMPKEHFDDPSQIGRSTDVYALAITFYQLLTGELPPVESGRYVVPGIIAVKGEGNRPVNKMKTILDTFVIRRNDDHTIEQFIHSVSNVPV